MKPLLVGEAPASPIHHADRPLSGSPARVLCGLLGVEGPDWDAELYERFDCVNLIPRYRDAYPWARSRAVAYAETVPVREVTVLLGRKVAEAFGVSEFYEWRRLPSGTCAIAVPHPSGRNRLLNEEAERERMGAALREALMEEIPA
jgi:uracil-DNA glycosylase